MGRLMENVDDRMKEEWKAAGKCQIANGRLWDTVEETWRFSCWQELFMVEQSRSNNYR